MYVCMRMCNGSKFVLNNASYFVYLYAKALNTYASMDVCVCVYNISCMTVKYIYRYITITLSIYRCVYMLM